MKFRNPEEVIEAWKKKGNPRTILDLSCWQIDELPNMPDEVEYLNISNSTIYRIKKLPKKLKWLKCQLLFNLIYFPLPLPENIQFIDCRYCYTLEPFEVPRNIKIRSHFKDTLEERYLENTPPEKILEDRLAEIRNTSKRRLDISNLGLTEFPEIPEDVKRLNCSSNLFTKIGKLPKSLKFLNCSHTPIKKFENIPDGLYKVECSDTYIDSFEGLPDSVKIITCEICDNLYEINYLPAELKYLSVTNSLNLYRIKYFPSKLIRIDITETKIENIPQLPNTLKYFYNRISCFIKNFENIPDSLEILDLGGGPSIPLLPQLPEGLKVLIIDNEKTLNGHPIPKSVEIIEIY